MTHDNCLRRADNGRYSINGQPLYIGDAIDVWCMVLGKDGMTQEAWIPGRIEWDHDRGYFFDNPNGPEFPLYTGMRVRKGGAA